MSRRRRRAKASSWTGGSRTAGSYRIVHRDGTVHWVDDQAVVLHGANGEPDMIQGVAIDVTASKEAELALRWSERQLREMVSGLRLIAVFTDMDGRIADVNPEFEHVTGWRRDDVAGRMWAEVCVPPDDAGQHTAFRRRWPRANRSPTWTRRSCCATARGG
ncbi:MAG: PAS domain-containing protein [Gaiellales bacterium]